MPIVTSLLDGLRRVVRAPLILVGAAMLTLLLAVPLGAAATRGAAEGPG